MTIFGDRHPGVSSAAVIVAGSAQWPTVRLIGDIDLEVAPTLRGVLSDLLDAGAIGVVIDMTEVTFFDANPLGVLVAARQRSHALGVDVVLRGAGEQVLRVLRLTTLEGLFSYE